jgi:hypothetical protein
MFQRNTAAQRCPATRPINQATIQIAEQIQTEPDSSDRDGLYGARAAAFKMRDDQMCIASAEGMMDRGIANG